MSQGQYIVYVNVYTAYAKRYSKVHRADCGSVRKNPGEGGRYGYWCGYYPTIENAKAEALRREPCYEFQECSRCCV